MKERLKTYQTHYKFYFKHKFYKVKNLRFKSNRPIFTLLFGEIGPGRLNIDDLSSLSSINNSLLGNKFFFLRWFISHKLILNEIPWGASGIWSTVSPARLAHRNTIGSAEQSRNIFAVMSLIFG